MPRPPAYTPGVVAAVYSAVIKQSGVIVWTCDHQHLTTQDAQICAVSEAALMREQEYLACPACKNHVDYLVEHLNTYTRDWTCQPRPTLKPKRKTTTQRRSV